MILLILSLWNWNITVVISKLSQCYVNLYILYIAYSNCSQTSKIWCITVARFLSTHIISLSVYQSVSPGVNNDVIQWILLSCPCNRSPCLVLSCLVLFFFIVDHEMDSHAENQNPSRKKCVINWCRNIVAQLKEICSRSFFTHSTCV